MSQVEVRNFFLMNLGVLCVARPSIQWLLALVHGYCRVVHNTLSQLGEAVLVNSLYQRPR